MCYLNNISFSIIAFFYVAFGAADKISYNFIHPCANRMHPDCLKTAIQEALPGFVQGSPELGTQSLDPLVFDRLPLRLPGNISVVFSDGVAEGFKQCKVTSAKLVKNNLVLSLRCNISIKGKYKSTGRLILFHIDGEGDCVIKCKNLDISVSLKLGTKIQNGVTHLQVNSYTTRHKYNGQVFYHMTNLIRNSPELSKAVVKFMNANWKMIAEEFGDPVVNIGVKLIMDEVKKLFTKVPLHIFMYPPNNDV